MNRTQRTVLVAAAMAGIVAGCMAGSGCARSSDNNTVTSAPGADASSGDAGKHDCSGKNSCKGQGGCGADKGKNSCKGQGGCNTKGSCKS